MVVYCASSFGYLLSAIFTNAQIAVQISPVVMIPFMMFGGFFANSSSYPDWVTWLQYISPIRYGLEALVLNEFEHRKYAPGDKNFAEYLGFDLGMWRCLVILAGMTIGLRLLAMIFLKLLVARF